MGITRQFDGVGLLQAGNAVVRIVMGLVCLAAVAALVALARLRPSKGTATMILSGDRLAP